MQKNESGLFSHHTQKQAQQGLKTWMLPESANCAEENMGSRFFEISINIVF